MPPDATGDTRASDSGAVETADRHDQSADEPVRGTRQTGRPEQVTPAAEIDWRGWLLVGVVCVSFLVIPSTILFLPDAQVVIATIGLTRRQTYLVLPMIPAIVLGLTAVWAALRTQTGP